MSGHECKQEYIWHMNERKFTHECWTCRYGGALWPIWAENIVVSPAKYQLMTAMLARGVHVDTDGSTLVVWDEQGRMYPGWGFATNKEYATYQKAQS